MGISLRPEHLKRYRDLARLLMRYGRSDLVRSAGLEGALEEGADPDAPHQPAEAEQLTADLEQMGPTFIKLGQLLSTRPDLLPQPYIDALSLGETTAASLGVALRPVRLVMDRDEVFKARHGSSSGKR